MTSTRHSRSALTILTSLAAGALLLAACSSSSSSGTTTAPSSSVATTASPGGGNLGTRPGSGGTGTIASGAACNLLTAADVTAATGNTVANAAEDDTNASAGEQTCVWTLSGSGQAGDGSAGPTITVNLETGANALPNFANLKTMTGIEHTSVSGVGDDAVLTAKVNLFVKVGQKVIEVSYMGVPTAVPQTFLTALAKAAVAKL